MAGIPGPTFVALMEARRKKKRGETLTDEEESLVAKYPEPTREPQENLSFGALGDALEALLNLPTQDGFVFLVGPPRKLPFRG